MFNDKRKEELRVIVNIACARKRALMSECDELQQFIMLIERMEPSLRDPLDNQAK